MNEERICAAERIRIPTLNNSASAFLYHPSQHNTYAVRYLIVCITPRGNDHADSEQRDTRNLSRCIMFAHE